MLKLEQRNRLLNLFITLISIVLFFEILFYHNTITNALSDFVTKIGSFGLVIIFILQYLQVIFIPIPAYFITLTSMKMFSDNMTGLFLTTLLAVILGVITAYLLGLKYGKKIVVWAAKSEDEYDKWLLALQNKKTNLFYFLTVLLPVFPDDILCFLAGSIKMNFWWFLIINVFARAFGLATFMFTFSSIENSLLTIIIFAVLLLVCIILKLYINKKPKERNKMNLLLIGEDIDDIALKIWEGNTNYMVINQSPDIFSKDFKRFSKDKDLIVVTTSEQFEKITVNDFINKMISLNFIPVFVVKDFDCLEYRMYGCVSDILKNSILYLKNENNTEFEDFVNLCRGYIVGKGLFEDDTVISTPRGGKEGSSKS